MGKIIKNRQCANCGINVPIYHKKRLTYENIFCGKTCESEFKKSKKMNCECEICHKIFHRKQSQIDKNKHQYCSRDCLKIARKYMMKGEKNHQYGLKGKFNASWKSDERISTYGYKLIRNNKHPYKNIDGFVFEHRLVAEQFLLTEENRILVNEKYYLSPEFHVHHLDFDKLNNSVENLYVIKKELHIKFHDSINIIVRDEENGRIKSIINAINIYSKEELKNMFFKFIENTKRGDGGFGSTGVN